MLSGHLVTQALSPLPCTPVMFGGANHALTLQGGSHLPPPPAGRGSADSRGCAARHSLACGFIGVISCRSSGSKQMADAAADGALNSVSRCQLPEDQGMLFHLHVQMVQVML